MELTEWRKIPGIPHRFEASRHGEVRRLPYELVVHSPHSENPYIRRFSEQILKPYLRKHNTNIAHMYVNVQIPRVGKPAVPRAQRVAFLVALAFHGEPPFGRQASTIRFKDGDVTNTAASNLEWIHQVKRPGFEANDAQSVYERNLTDWEDLDKSSAGFMRTFYPELAA
ncbi:hypothetical protein [Mycolicibacterium palauense]|uniref:hypothetical protein n=1 Tax=Mycolicibacterium palauense TaxID=2034511 RepID=UPI000BFEEB8E|nr:hypothetical protein [Mycolicibacterium palauense]